VNRYGIRPKERHHLGLKGLQRLKTARKGEWVQVDDLWGYGRSLEWTTSCPAPRHDLHVPPRVRSASPAFLHHPNLAQPEQQPNAGQRDVVGADDHKGEPG
jgi:cytochrome c oxidase subunit 1